MSAPSAAAVFASVLPVPTAVLDPAIYAGGVGQWFVDTERWALDAAHPAMASDDLGGAGVVNAAAAILADIRGGADLVGRDDVSRTAVGQWLATESFLTVGDLTPDIYGTDDHSREYTDHVALFTAYRERLTTLGAVLAAASDEEAR